MELGVETAQVVGVPCVCCFGSILGAETEDPLLWHTCNDEWTVPLGLELALFVRVSDDDQITRVDVFVEHFLVSLALRFGVIFVEIFCCIQPIIFRCLEFHIPLEGCVRRY